jgi:hypothetical protein
MYHLIAIGFLLSTVWACKDHSCHSSHCPRKCRGNATLSYQQGYQLGFQRGLDLGRQQCTDVPTVTTLTVTTLPVSIPTATVSPDTSPIPSSPVQSTAGPIVDSSIPITFGTQATLTYFTDSTTQCYGSNIPPGNGIAINPLLLGFSTSDWTNKYVNADPSQIPWCGKQMSITVKGQTFTGLIIDSCNPEGNPFTDPITGQLIGGKCDYDNVIDLYGQPGLAFLQSVVGDDFYQGAVQWQIN